MNKHLSKNDWINTAGICYASIMMVLFSLLVSFGVEVLLKESFRLG